MSQKRATAPDRTPSSNPAVPTGSLVETAYRTLRQRVIDNAWPPGYRALEQELALELGMSRTPLREALVRLQNEGLVEVIPRHGMRVLPVSADDMRDIYQMLTALEAMAAELAARRRLTRAQLKPLLDAAAATEHALNAEDLDAWASADESFHRNLVELSGNRLLVEVARNCADRAHRARAVTLRMRPKPTHSTREHMDVVEKIRAGDARAAFDAQRAHRERGTRELLAILEYHQLKTL
ncbi:MAG TPA: GntR family transcriptional regulator [Acetobacteraceae bacterium]|nr:GntR family transcriptional regulator [Acetobacteraceae bacterium]